MDDVVVVRINFIHLPICDFRVSRTAAKSICEAFDNDESKISFMDVNYIRHCIDAMDIVMIRVVYDVFDASLVTPIDELKCVSADDERLTRRTGQYFPVFVDNPEHQMNKMEIIRWCPVYFYNGRSVVNFHFKYYYIPNDQLGNIEER